MRERLIPALALGGLIAVIAVALVVFQFGRKNPSPDSLEDTPIPAIPGEILFRNGDNCVVRADASGATREEVYCGYPEAVSQKSFGTVIWIDENTIGFPTVSETDTTRIDIVEVNLETKEETVRRNVASAQSLYREAAVSPDGERAEVLEDGKLVYTVSGERTEIADFDLESYQLWPVVWSPDSQWLVLSYQHPHGDGRELWIVSRDGTVQGTLVTGSSWQTSPAGEASWLISGVGITPVLE